MQLELKHLAAYLPYEVCYTCVTPPQIGGERIISFINITNLYLIYDMRELNDFKLIIRPLPYLIIDKGIIEDFIGIGNWCNAYDEYIDSWYPDASYAQQAPYVIFEYFLANHYDVFSLIPNNLAVDINSLPLNATGCKS